MMNDLDFAKQFLPPVRLYIRVYYTTRMPWRLAVAISIVDHRLVISLYWVWCKIPKPRIWNRKYTVRNILFRKDISVSGRRQRVLVHAVFSHRLNIAISAIREYLPLRARSKPRYFQCHHHDCLTSWPSHLTEHIDSQRINMHMQLLFNIFDTAVKSQDGSFVTLG